MAESKDSTHIENALITSTMLGYEDHGILTAFVHVSGEGWGVGFGGFALDAWDEATKKRIGTAYGCQFIADVLRVVGVDAWEKLAGQHVRVESEGLGGRALRLGHITKNQWFDPRELATRYRSEAPVSR